MKRLLIGALSAAVLTGCGGLSRKAKEIIGVYYNDAVSADVPVFELNDNGTCIMRAIRPEVLTISVSGTWNVEDDSLVIVHDLTTLKAEGDTSLVGNIPPTYRAALIDHTPQSLVLGRNGIEYEYTQRYREETDGE